MTDDRGYKTGIISMLGCDVLWGVLPLYWQALRPIDSWVIIFYRIFLVGLVAGIASLWIYGLPAIREQLAVRSNLWKFPLAGCLITCNWSIYIWAVNADHVIQTCVGYYIEPLIVCLLGILIFREKVTRYKLIAMLFALAGLVVILIHFMEPPLIAVSIATSFAVYAAVKKWFDLPPIMSVFLETLFLMLPALCVIIGIEVTGHGALAVATPGKYLLLLCCGILTATPLSLFAAAATKVPMITVGLLEYLSPSIALLIGIFFMKEPFDAVQLAAFVIIWVGLVFFTYGECKGENDV
ncbi:EamA family transporter RarD [Eubacterium sp. AB3007]|uniref:EamA family transporter RarD n=1 Tax=Eubacterium sp. AB3007 TaxID=1392487 RepID=UPI000480E2D0|nr:EamA family transporter RarD [Eubacterium sp. AB3007]